MRLGAKPPWLELEDKVVEWILDKCSKGIGLSGSMMFEGEADSLRIASRRTTGFYCNNVLAL